MKSIYNAITVVAGVAVLAAGLAVAETTTQKKPTTKSTAATHKRTDSKKASTAAKTPATSAGKTTSASKTPAPSHKTGTTTKRRSTTASAKPPSATWRTRQLQPTPDRYKEIQQALVSKGYLKAEPSGAWNQDSVDALRRFQQDQSLDPSGKIDALSLIALGLGPKHETASAKPPAPPAPTTTN